MNNDEQFIEHLEDATKIVDSYPKWKQELLGWTKKEQETETYCSCCGVANSEYNKNGHDKECVWYEQEIYRLANEWLNDNLPYDDWKRRYNLVVKFLLDE